MLTWIDARVNMKLDGWKENLMSKAGKEILIKSMVQAIPQYAMSIFIIPASICKATERKVADFWCKNCESKSSLHWKKKREVLKSWKDEGSMGYRDLALFNRALLDKQAWRLSRHLNSLWCRVFKRIYFLRRYFWQANKGHHPPWGCQSILMGRETIENSVQWIVETGEKINIREDRWLKRGILGGRPTWMSQLK